MTSNGPASSLEVAEQLGAGDRGGGDLLGRTQDVDRAEPLALEPGQAAAQLAALAAEHVRAEVPVRAAGVALRAELLRQVQDDRHRQHVVRAGQHDELAAGFGLHVGRVDDGEAAAGQPLARDVVQQLERGRRGGLVVLVVGDQTAAEVRGDHLGRLEVRAGERRLAGTGRAHQDDQAQLGDAQFGWPRNGWHCHRVPSRSKTASWVGGPVSGCSGPTGRKRTW